MKLVYGIVICAIAAGFFGLVFGIMVPRFGMILTLLLMIVLWAVASLADASLKIKIAQWEQRKLNR
jgi:hypothetical protein